MCRSMFERFSYAMSDIKHTVNTETMFCFETSLTRGKLKQWKTIEPVVAAAYERWWVTFEVLVIGF